MRPGRWSAVSVDLDNRGTEWKGRLAISETGSSRGLDLELPPRSRRTVWMPVTLDQQSAKQQLQLEASDGSLSSIDFQLNLLGHFDVLVAAVSEESLAVGSLAQATSPTGPGWVHLAPVSPQDLPPSPLAYDSLDAMLVSRWQPAALTPEQVRALQGWVAHGGVLLVSAERDLARLRVPWLKAMLPASVSGDAALGVLPALEKHTGLPRDPRDPAPWSVRLEVSPGSKTLLTGDGHPLVVSKPYGMGHVLLFAFDTTDPSLSSYDGWPILALELLSLHLKRPRNIQEIAAQDSEAAQSLEGPLRRRTLPKSNPGRRFAVFGLVYLLILFPTVWLLLRRLGRPEAAWLCRLAIIACFTVTAWGLGASGRVPLVREAIFIVSAPPDSPLGRLTGWIDFFSSRRETRTVDLPADVEAVLDPLRPTGAHGRPSSPLRRNWRFHRKGGASQLRMGMEAGELVHLKLVGTKTLGGGLGLTPVEISTRQGVGWENRTGRHFDKLLLVFDASRVLVATQPAPPGASGAFFLDASVTLPLSQALEDAGRIVAHMIASAGPGSWWMIGIPPPEAPPDERGRERWLYLWPVPHPAKPLSSWPNLQVLDPRPYRGGWHLSGTTLAANADALTLQVPAPRFEPPEADALVRLAGTWTRPPRLQLYDRVAGRWVEIGLMHTGSSPASRYAQNHASVGRLTRAARFLWSETGIARARFIPDGPSTIQYLTFPKPP